MTPTSPCQLSSPPGHFETLGCSSFVVTTRFLLILRPTLEQCLPFGVTNSCPINLSPSLTLLSFAESYSTQLDWGPGFRIAHIKNELHINPVCVCVCWLVQFIQHRDANFNHNGHKRKLKTLSPGGSLSLFKKGLLIVWKTRRQWQVLTTGSCWNIIHYYVYFLQYFTFWYN